MKNRQLLDLMSLADDKYVSESDPSRIRQSATSSSSAKFKWTTFLAAACCFLLILNIVIFVPLLTRDDPVAPPISSGPDASTSGGMNQVQSPSDGKEDEEPSNGDGSTTIVGNDDLLEALDKLITDGNELGNDVQGSGAILDFSNESQADIIASTDTHVFYLRGKELCVYALNDGEGTLVSLISLSGYVDELREYTRSIGWLEVDTGIADNYAYTNGWKMHLSQDKKTLTLIAVPGKSPVTGVLTFDISRAPTVNMVDFKILSGTYVSSHAVNGDILLFTRYQIQKRYKKDKPVTYMPFYWENGKETVSQNIYFPNDINSSAYLMITRLNEGSSTVEETAAYLSYSDKVYVSDNNIFLTRRVFAGDSDIDYLTVPYDTEISVISYGDGKLTHKGTATVNGYVNDGACLNERNGILFLATTSFVPKGGQSYVWYETSASLYCIDLESMKTLAKAEHFATEGEKLYSVSYDGDTAYAYTSINGILADPVFVFDLSDLKNITYDDGETKQDYPLSLVDFGNGYFLSIGVGSNSQALKIDVYKEDSDKMSLVHTQELKNTYFSTDCSGYYIDPSKKLIGIAIKAYEASVGYSNKYLLLSFDGESLVTLLNTSVPFSDRNTVRSFYQKGYYYVITDTGVYAFDLEI